MSATAASTVSSTRDREQLDCDEDLLLVEDEGDEDPQGDPP